MTRAELTEHLIYLTMHSFNHWRTAKISLPNADPALVLVYAA